MNPTVIEGEEALALLLAPPVGELPDATRSRVVAQSLAQLGERGAELDAFAQRRAGALLADHQGVRAASRAQTHLGVKAMLPPDVIGLYTLMPKPRDA